MSECRVGIILDLDVPEQKTVALALRAASSLQADMEIEFIPLDTQCTESAVRTQVLYALDRGYEVLVASGGAFAELVAKVLREMGGHPYLFLSVRDPVKRGIVQSLENPGNHTTGVIREPLANTVVIQKLLPLVKKRKGLLIPYSPAAEAGHMAQQIIDIKRYLAEHTTVNVLAVEISNADDAMIAFEKHLGRYDTALILEGLPVTRAAHELSKFCWDNDIVLCGYGLRFLEAGAACTMGGEGAPYADAAFSMIKRFWFDQENLGTMPVVTIRCNQRFIVNVDMLRRVGMTTDDILEFTDQVGVEVIRRWKY